MATVWQPFSYSIDVNGESGTMSFILLRLLQLLPFLLLRLLRLLRLIHSSLSFFRTMYTTSIQFLLREMRPFNKFTWLYFLFFLFSFYWGIESVERSAHFWIISFGNTRYLDNTCTRAHQIDDCLAIRHLIVFSDFIFNDIQEAPRFTLNKYGDSKNLFNQKIV